MKVLLLHLSDIHIQTVDDIVLTRVSKIVDAVKNLDSDVRADRLDYVSRDLFASGVYRDTIQYSRLLPSFRLHVATVTPGDIVPSFLPGTGSLSTIEDFLWQRLFSYKYVAFHHRVAKTDGLLREALVGLGKSYLQSEDGTEDEEVPLPEYLTINISGLWRILGIDRRYGEILAKCYSQWDDSWLLAVLRRHFFQNDLKINDTLRVQCDELLSNRKNYVSLVKRPDDFLEIDQAFREAAAKSIDDFQWRTMASVNAHEKLKDVLQPVCNDLVKMLKSGKLSNRAGGFFLAHLIYVLRKSAARCYPSLLDLTGQAIQKELGFDHVLVVPKRLKPGISDAQQLFGEAGPVLLNQISRIVEEMERAAISFPPFFIFYYDAVPKDPKRNHMHIRKQFGKKLFEVYHTEIKSTPP